MSDTAAQDPRPVSQPDDPVRVWDRRAGAVVEETVLGDAFLRLAYLSPVSGLFRGLLFRSSLLTRLSGWYCDTGWSRHKIRRTIETLGIDESEFRDPIGSYRTFNEFFCRHLRAGARPFDSAPEVLCSPADCRLTVFPALDGATCIPVKGTPFSLDALLADPQGASAEFAGGSLMVARLCPADYHRFHYPAAGRTLRRWDIDGKYHSVNPLVLALGLPVFTENRRIVNLIELDRCGHTAFIEVGAFGVAGIVQTHEGAEFAKMDEKGYFRFGGSTVILVFRADTMAFDPDLIANSAKGLETLVRAGETIGTM